MPCRNESSPPQTWPACARRSGSRPRPRSRRATPAKPSRSSIGPSTQWSGLKDYSINWITSLLTFIGEELGEEAVEAALRKTGEEFVRPRRDTGTEWSSLPAAVRAKVIARAMLGNMGAVDVDEDDEKITLSFRCGSGGKLIDDGRYDGDHPYLRLRERAPRTFDPRRALGVLRALLGQQRDPAGGVGRRPEQRRASPARPGEPCVHHIYKDVDDVPAEAYTRIGQPIPDRRNPS